MLFFRAFARHGDSPHCSVIVSSRRRVVCGRHLKMTPHRRRLGRRRSRTLADPVGSSLVVVGRVSRAALDGDGGRGSRSRVSGTPDARAARRSPRHGQVFAAERSVAGPLHRQRLRGARGPSVNARRPAPESRHLGRSERGARRRFRL